VCTHFLNIRDIILVGDDNIIFKLIYKNVILLKIRFNYSNHTYFGSKISKWYPL